MNDKWKCQAMNNNNGEIQTIENDIQWVMANNGEL